MSQREKKQITMISGIFFNFQTFETCLIEIKIKPKNFKMSWFTKGLKKSSKAK